MSRAKELIKQFEAEETNLLEQEDDSEKVNIIQELEDLADPSIHPFFLKVVADKREYDLARIEVLKIFELRDKASAEETLAISQVIANLLNDGDDDTDVRSYAAMAASNFMDNAAVLSSICTVLLEVEEESEIRWNAFAALKRHGKTTQSIAVLRELGDTPFKKAKATLMQEWLS